ncbi:M20/M25/M40 family metallo-hydrolase [Marilutibacter spongiae]|uniref:M20/M25/M40 family metallo-hydrolase n=1 Tax=Marilutibacter spongiae TaxID=2025720 RepID=A0A7W3Y579_9GAMM|nr:M20/M25/M40 family metallo-hydrolase [Lysobacter spongiae]MBB1059581.1 M20/M25/M40 family metallo-hydrolase [Lysobacter spongiae]
MRHAFLKGLGVVVLGVASAGARASGDPGEAEFRALYRELVETNTTLSSGSCTRAAEAMGARLREAGLPASDVEVIAPPDRPRDGALVALLRGSDARLKPLMLLAHIDVVEARREDWARDPFTLVEEDGFFYARGAADDKAMAAALTDSLVRYRQEGYVPRRGIKLALTCGEETPDTFNSVRWLLQTRPDVLDAAFVINEGAGGELDADGKPVALQVQAGEKVYQDFRLGLANSGGHSSRPKKENAIVQMSAALVRLGAYRFPIAVNPAVRAYFEAQAGQASPEVAADIRAVLADPADEAAALRLWDVNPGWNGMLRTTCIPSMVEGGHAPNAQPQKVTANVNCRILPGVPVDTVQATLARVLDDPSIGIEPVGEIGQSTVPPPLDAGMLAPVREVAEGIWPGVAIVPTMTTGGTDGRFLNAAGIPTYGVSGMFHDAEGSHAHGLDERIRVQSLLDGRRFLYALVRRYADSGWAPGGQAATPAP